MFTFCYSTEIDFALTTEQVIGDRVLRTYSLNMYDFPGMEIILPLQNPESGISSLNISFAKKSPFVSNRRGGFPLKNESFQMCSYTGRCASNLHPCSNNVPMDDLYWGNCPTYNSKFCGGTVSAWTLANTEKMDIIQSGRMYPSHFYVNGRNFTISYENTYTYSPSISFTLRQMNLEPDNFEAMEGKNGISGCYSKVAAKYPYCHWITINAWDCCANTYTLVDNRLSLDQLEKLDDISCEHYSNSFDIKYISMILEIKSWVSLQNLRIDTLSNNTLLIRCWEDSILSSECDIISRSSPELKRIFVECYSVIVDNYYFTNGISLTTLCECGPNLKFRDDKHIYYNYTCEEPAKIMGNVTVLEVQEGFNWFFFMIISVISMIGVTVLFMLLFILYRFNVCNDAYVRKERDDDVQLVENRDKFLNEKSSDDEYIKAQRKNNESKLNGIGNEEKRFRSVIKNTSEDI